ncbi:MAG: hypothetical protein E7632_11935 [Ruminococcaceae bacterium]|nr:hypothetical protein [Oscillospiraceae bacterium]
MKFLGTGAGEGTPDPFCTCPVCENARRVGGREVRTRSSFMLSDTMLIDIGADYFAQAVMQGVSFADLEHILITHTHDDHLNYTFLWERLVRRAGAEQTLHVYFTGEAYDYINDFYLSAKGVGSEKFLQGVELVRLEHGMTYDIGGWKVTPLRGRHGTAFEKNTANFLMEKGGESLYYALDSGYFLDETFDALAGRRIGTFIMECTNAIIENGAAKQITTFPGGHMDLALCLMTLDRLYESGGITADSRIYLTHISPNRTTHAELCEFLAALDKPYRITAAYDGLEI